MFTHLYAQYPELEAILEADMSADPAVRGAKILADYNAKITREPGKDGLQAALGDLLADLMHASRMLGLEFHDAVAMAERHFDDEVTE